MAPVTQHQAKRPYAGTHSSQSAITAYFPSASLSSRPAGNGNRSAVDISSSSSSKPSSTPALPASVQSNLLSVGMRVRKSVPEGYKTGTYSAFSLFSESSSSSKPVAAPQYRTTATTSTTTYNRAATELTPYCGILKVGGLASQQTQSIPDVDDVPFLSSQASTISAASVTSKRRFVDEREEEEEDEDDLDLVDIAGDDEDETTWHEAEISPLSRPRTLAMPKSRRRRVIRSLEKVQGGSGREKMDFDFGEAEFLDYEVWREVEMEDA